jgi:uncharacterized protein YdaU (DUF1376 family)
MNFMRLYIGDYLRDTGTLSVAEHGAYMLMLMHHYATEKPLPSGRELHRLIRAETKAERDAADAVLARFWTETPDGWVNGRAGREFARAEHQAETNRQIAVRREEAKRARKAHEQSTNRAPVVHEHPTDTRHQTPDTRQQRQREVDVVAAEPPGCAADATPTPRATRLAKDWQLPRSWGEWAIDTLPGWTAAAVRLEADKFRDFWVAKSGKDATKLDWEATWRNWMRNARAPASMPGRPAGADVFAGAL